MNNNDAPVIYYDCLLRSCTLLYFLAHTFYLILPFLLVEYSRQYILLVRIYLQLILFWKLLGQFVIAMMIC